MKIRMEISRKEAKKTGFFIDEGQRPVAYMGPRFQPTVLKYLATEMEEDLLTLVKLAHEAMSKDGGRVLDSNPAKEEFYQRCLQMGIDL